LKKPNLKKWVFLAVPVMAVLGQTEMSQAHQPETLIPGLIFYLLALFLFLWFSKEKEDPPLKETMPLKWEWILFFLIFTLAFFLRLFRIDSVPSGIYIDAAGPSSMALRMLNEHLRPPFMIAKFANSSYILYFLSFWFRFLQPTQTYLFLFFVLIAMAAFPLIYWTLRQLAGPRPALLALYFITIMRWHIVLSRNGLWSIQVLFYMFGTLAFFLYGIKSGKKWPFILSALFLSGGFYTYQAFKILPLLILIYLVFEYRRNPKNISSKAGILAISAILFLTLTWPIFHNWIQEGSLGTRESELFIGNAISREKSWKPLMNKITQTALVFNRKGEEQPKLNVKDHRLLDDVTAPLFILGLFYALYRLRQRPYFYAVSGFLVMILPEILTCEHVQSHRMLGAIPFVAFFAADSFLVLEKNLVRIFPRFKPGIKTLSALLLLAALAQNLKIYFVDQAQDYDCWRNYSIEATTVGKTIVQHPDTTYYLAPSFYDHYTVEYLDYYQWNRVQKLDWDSLNHQNLATLKPKICFVLDEGKKPAVEFLKNLYPGGTEEIFRDRFGNSLAYFYTIPSSVKTFSYERGLEGEYFNSTDFSEKPLFKRWDPFINFVNIGDFGINQPPLSVQWKGELNIPRPGRYEFLIFTSDQGDLWVDGKQVIDHLKDNNGTIKLKGGKHSVRLTCRRIDNPDVVMNFNLAWKKPGQKNYEMVPNPVFGKIHP
jgi:4-amino-4-deoxy-L-arabinose transferase-like glycosyltransferase